MNIIVLKEKFIKNLIYVIPQLKSKGMAKIGKFHIYADMWKYKGGRKIEKDCSTHVPLASDESHVRDSE